jgi:ribonuclease BN (tRNA processing enzyme)
MREPMPDLRVTVLGSADAFSHGGRGNSCYLIEDDLGAVAVDFGPTAMRALRHLKKDPDDLDGVMLTHLHGDHFGGLHLLFIDARYRAKRRRPLVIAGPPGTKRTVSAWIALGWGAAGRQRPPFRIKYLEYRPGSSLTILGRRVTVFAARHQSHPEVSTSLRIASDGRTMAFSGDTQWSENLVPLSDGTDLFICECTGARQTPKHLSWTELRPRLVDLRARRILLSHLSDEARARIRPRDRRVRLADDGMVVTL